MNAEPSRPDGDDEPTHRRLYLFEPGWRVAMKVGNEREFCYMMAPGQDYYHRIYDGEIYVHRADERICMACAGRRGLLSFAPRALRESLGSVEIVLEDSANEFGFGLGDNTGWDT